MRVSVRLSVFCVVLPVMFSPSFAAFSVYTMASISFAFFAFFVCSGHLILFSYCWLHHHHHLLQQLISSPSSLITFAPFFPFFFALSKESCQTVVTVVCYCRDKTGNRAIQTESDRHTTFSSFVAVSALAVDAMIGWCLLLHILYFAFFILVLLLLSCFVCSSSSVRKQIHF